MMKAAMSKAGKKGRYIEFSGEGHRNWTAANEAAYLDALERFLFEEFYDVEMQTIAEDNASAFDVLEVSQAHPLASLN